MGQVTLMWVMTYDLRDDIYLDLELLNVLGSWALIRGAQTRVPMTAICGALILV